MTTPAAPPVTIGLPVYNGARHLEEAVRSLLDETFEDFALVISDNCSTDETPAICARLCEHDSRISFVRREKNLGASENFKYFASARSEPLLHGGGARRPPRCDVPGHLHGTAHRIT